MMTMYKEKSFDLPAMEGFSEKQISEHLKLYAGYVKNINLLEEKIAALKENAHSISSGQAEEIAIAELKRRQGFEFNGMRLHEYYFEQLGGNGEIKNGNGLMKVLSEQYGSFDAWLTDFKQTAMMRGTGWAILYQDIQEKKFFNVWVNSHEDGHLAGLTPLLVLDVWEHAFLFDYLPSQRKDYIEAFFKNLRWEVVEKRHSS